jgi:hypothetical protein
VQLLDLLLVVLVGEIEFIRKVDWRMEPKQG